MKTGVNGRKTKNKGGCILGNLNKLQDKYSLQAFEVEDIGRRENYMFVYNPYDQTVELYDTSRSVIGGKKLKSRIAKDFPFECETAYQYFKYLYDKSVKFEEDNDIYFIGWVHPESVMPVVELKKRKLKNEITNLEEIKSKLRLKHREFCSSIKDWKLRKVFRKHTYIAGGAIASLIRGEEPKDYDIFFDNKKALEEILKYYVDRHNARYEETNSNYKLTVSSDYSSVGLFLNHPYVKSDEEDNKDMNPVMFSMRAVSFPNGFQLIIDNDTQESKSVNRFDFVHTMGYFHPFQNKLVVKPETLAAIKENKLIYNYQGSNPIGSAKRLLRFISRGWEIENKEHMKLLKKISHIDHDPVFDLEGVDYFF